MELKTEKTYKLELSSQEAKQLEHICQCYNPTETNITGFERECSRLSEDVEMFLQEN